MMPKPPKDFCIDSFEYREYLGENSWSEPEYAEAILIEHCRIDRERSTLQQLAGNSCYIKRLFSVIRV